MSNLPWVIDAAAARVLIAEGAAVVDARRDELREALPVVGAVPLAWTALTHAEHPDKGRLLDDNAELSVRLSALGLSHQVPIVVFTDSLAGGGEDGRLVWALRTLGHEAVALVDGGVAALLADGPPAIRPPVGGGFAVNRTARWEITREQLRDELAAGAVAVLDTREPREYGGETPYGESRGGHVPGARHLWYRDLIGADGRVVGAAALAERLRDIGIGRDDPIVAYCTGGVRAAFVTTVLTSYGYHARNYAGSMWHWAAGAADLYPLVRAAPA